MSDTTLLFSYALFGLMLNFVFSFAFGLYLVHMIGLEEMARTHTRPPSVWVALSMVVPFAKMLLTLYRVAILQFLFLNQGKTHAEYWMDLNRID